MKDLKKIQEAFDIFSGPFKKELRDKLLKLRTALEASPFFASHEVIGSSLLLLRDEEKIGVWMIDWAKAIPLEKGEKISHRGEWRVGVGCREDGVLIGVDNLIDKVVVVVGDKGEW